MLTGVVVCLVCLGVGLKLIQSGTITLGSSASSAKDDLEPIPDLSDPVPVPVEPTPASTAVPVEPRFVPRSVAAFELEEEVIPPPSLEGLPATAQQVPPPPEPLMPPASDGRALEPPPADTITSSPIGTSMPLPQVVAQPASLSGHGVPTIRAMDTAVESVPLIGTHPANVEKNQLTLPAEVRKQLGDVRTVYLTPGTDGCLVLCPTLDLEVLVEVMPLTGRRMDMAIRRLQLARTERVTLDVDGRCTIPEHLAKRAGLSGEAVVIGVGDHWELWDAQRWQKYQEEMEQPEPPQRGASSSSSQER
jgi:MraZ protein